MDKIYKEMVSILTTTPERWISLFQNLSPELIAQPPAPKEWSALECLQHLVDSERVFQFRVRAFLSGQDFPNFNQESEGTPVDAQNHFALAEDFARLRDESLRMLAQFNPADLGRTAQHAELGIVTLDEMFHNWAAHDLNHTAQAERAPMKAFIDGCGPWKMFY